MPLLEQLFEKTHQLPTIPRVVQELIDSFNHEDDIDIFALARKVALDQVLTAKVLRLANSAYYGVQRRIGSVDEAIVVMGFNGLRSLVVATGVTAAFAAVPGLDRPAFWRHSVRVAMYSRWVARTVRVSPDVAFTAGLMHAIGVMLIHLTAPDEAAQVELRVGRGDNRYEAEKEILGFSHGDAGAELARRWNFPEDIVLAIRYQHNPLECDPFIPLTGVVHFGIWLTDTLTKGPDLQVLRTTWPEGVAQRLGVKQERILEDLPSLEDISSGVNAFLT